jgi:mRNA-degrading endonuclease YafQ of YafQ-DinJ toxin-antitoxin module
MRVFYTPSFVRQFNTLEVPLQEEVIEKIDLFQDSKNHASLRVHKLHGRLKGRFSFSVNYKIRIVFMRLPKNDVALLAIGDHKVYEQ